MSPRTNKGKISFHRGFKKPTREKILKSLETGAINFKHDKALIKHIENFSSIRNPTDSLDWLAQFNEPQQTCEEFHRTCPFNSNEVGSNLFIYYVQIGEFSRTLDDDFNQLVEYSKCFFSDESVKVLNIKVDIRKLDSSNKVGFTLQAEYAEKKGQLKFRFDNESGHIQIFTQSLLKFLRLVKPDNACCLIGLTEWDLYAESSDLFVAGLADGEYGVAAFSCLRYNPNLEYSEEFWHDYCDKKARKTVKDKRLILQRTCKLLVHETCHLLGFAHCAYMDCCMNGSGHLEEDFRQSMFLCPVCLKKLLFVFDFEPVKRYKAMATFFEKHKLSSEIKWLANANLSLDC